MLDSMKNAGGRQDLITRRYGDGSTIRVRSLPGMNVIDVNAPVPVEQVEKRVPEEYVTIPHYKLFFGALPCAGGDAYKMLRLTAKPELETSYAMLYQHPSYGMTAFYYKGGMLRETAKRLYLPVYAYDRVDIAEYQLPNFEHIHTGYGIISGGSYGYPKHGDVDQNQGIGILIHYKSSGLGYIHAINLPEHTAAGELETTVSSRLQLVDVDSDNNTAYVGTRTNPATIIRISVNPLAEIGTLVLSDASVYASGKDFKRGKIYYSTYYGKIHRVDVATFSEEAIVELWPTYGSMWPMSGITDTRRGYYIALYEHEDGSYRVVKVNLRNFAQDGITVVDTGVGVVSTVNNYPQPVVIDEDNGLVYFAISGDSTQDGKLLKVSVSTLEVKETITPLNGYYLFGEGFAIKAGSSTKLELEE